MQVRNETDNLNICSHRIRSSNLTFLWKEMPVFLHARTKCSEPPVTVSTLGWPGHFLGFLRCQVPTCSQWLCCWSDGRAGAGRAVRYRSARGFACVRRLEPFYNALIRTGYTKHHCTKERLYTIEENHYTRNIVQISYSGSKSYLRVSYFNI